MAYWWWKEAGKHSFVICNRFSTHTNTKNPFLRHLILMEYSSTLFQRSFSIWWLLVRRCLINTYISFDTTILCNNYWIKWMNVKGNDTKSFDMLCTNEIYKIDGCKMQRLPLMHFSIWWNVKQFFLFHLLNQKEKRNGRNIMKMQTNNNTKYNEDQAHLAIFEHKK